jgi:hypothetical protein
VGSAAGGEPLIHTLGEVAAYSDTNRCLIPLRRPAIVRRTTPEFPEILTDAARRAMGIEAPNKIFDTVLSGRSTYEIGLAVGITNAYPHPRHLVFSTTMGQSPDPTVELVVADPSQGSARSEDRGRPGHLDRRRRQAGTRTAARDRPLDPQQNPSVIGSGVPMFDGPFQPQLFRATDLRQLDSGIRILSFDRL